MHEELHAYDMPNRIEIGIVFDILGNFEFLELGSLIPAAQSTGSRRDFYGSYRKYSQSAKG